MKYLLEKPVKGVIGAQKYKTSIAWRKGELITDEPEKLGGQDLGPDPYTLLLSSLITCTLVTLKMYIERKELDITDITVEANMYYRIVKGAVRTRIERRIIFPSALDTDLRDRLLEIADQCPVSKMLKQGADVETII